jgi:hypothetical protein
VRLRIAALAGLVAVLVVVITPSTALADTSSCSVPAATCAGKVEFQSYGEIFRIYDQVADGHSAVLQYWLSDGTGPHWEWNHGGSGTVVEVNLELPEGDWIFYKACLGEYGTKTLVDGTCSAGVTDYA